MRTQHAEGKRVQRDHHVTVNHGTVIARYDDHHDARLSVASDNAVIELAEHLGVNAVLLAERLQGGGLVRLVELVDRMADRAEFLAGFEHIHGDTYVAVKNDGEGTGWSYHCTGLTCSDFNEAAGIIANLTQPTTLE